ncbi:MAB_1171c family putative transporter [Streptomyces sp. NPDC002845]
MESGIVYYIPGVLLLLAAVLRLSAGRGVWRDPLVAASSAILLIGSAVCVLAAPPTIRLVNDATGVANVSAPLVYGGMTALSAGYLILMITWKGGPPERQWHAARLVLGVYGLVVVGIWVLFALADVPVERARDLDTYYANTPYMREMIVLYLVAHTAATVVLAIMSVSWLREVHGVTRAGLLLIVVSLTFDAGYQFAKYAAIGARWTGHDWDVLSTDISPPLVMVAGITSACGFALPRIGPPAVANLRAWRRYRQLRPLMAELHALRAPATGIIRWWDPPVVRLARQEIAIWDGVLVCSPYLDDQVRTTAYAKALAHRATGRASGVRSAAGTVTRWVRKAPRACAGDDSPRHVVDHATVVAEAAMLAAAGVRVSQDAGAEPPADVGTLRSVSQPRLMVGLSRALSSSPIVAEARREAALRMAVSRD